jgi:hypothetical protein
MSMNMPKWTLVMVFPLLVLSLIFGCASVGDPTMKKMLGPAGHMEKFKDKHRDELIKDWGTPAEEKSLEHGGRELVYKRDYSMPGQHFRYKQACQMMFRTDSQGIVRSWTYEGC